MKHDAHVLKFKMQHFPLKLFLLVFMIGVFLGVFIGQIWGFSSCLNLKAVGL